MSLSCPSFFSSKQLSVQEAGKGNFNGGNLYPMWFRGGSCGLSPSKEHCFQGLLSWVMGHAIFEDVKVHPARKLGKSWVWLTVSILLFTSTKHHINPVNHAS